MHSRPAILTPAQSLILNFFVCDYNYSPPRSLRVSLKAFQKFGNTTEALAATTAIVESKLGKDLKKFLKKQAKGEQLGVSDPKLAGIIKDKTGVQCLHNSMVNELLRGIRLQMTDLITGLGEGELSNMVLGLSHSLCRYKLKFSPDKVDHMIIQAIGSLILSRNERF